MSDRPQRIAKKYLPMPSPLLITLVTWLLLDRIEAPGWVWGACGVMLLILAAVWIADLVYTNHVHPRDLR